MIQPRSQASHALKGFHESCAGIFRIKIDSNISQNWRVGEWLLDLAINHASRLSQDKKDKKAAQETDSRLGSSMANIRSCQMTGTIVAPVYIAGCLFVLFVSFVCFVCFVCLFFFVLFVCSSPMNQFRPRSPSRAHR